MVLKRYHLFKIKSCENKNFSAIITTTRYFISQLNTTFVSIRSSLEYLSLSPLSPSPRKSLFILNITLSRPPPSYWFPVTPAAGEFYPPDINKSIRRNGVLKRVRVTDWRVATRRSLGPWRRRDASRDDQSLGQAFFPFFRFLPLSYGNRFFVRLGTIVSVSFRRRVTLSELGFERKDCPWLGGCF